MLEILRDPATHGILLFVIALLLGICAVNLHSVDRGVWRIADTRTRDNQISRLIEFAEQIRNGISRLD